MEISRKLNNKIFYLLLGVFVSSTSSANTYISIGYASLNYENPVETYVSGDPATGIYTRSTVEEYESGTPVKFTVGVKLHEIIAVEFAYMDLGDFGYTRRWEQQDIGLQQSSVDSVEYTGSLIGPSIKLMYSANNSINLYGRLGYYFSQGDFTRRRVGVSTLTNNNWDYTSSGEYDEKVREFGVGASYVINENFEVNIEYNNYGEVVDDIKVSGAIMNFVYVF